MAASDPNVVYAGMGEHAIRGVMTSHGDGVYRSTDAGKTWTHLGLDRTRAISRIRVHPDDPDLVYVAAQGAPYGANEERGIFRSADGGRTWKLILYVDENTGASDLSMDMTNSRILYAGAGPTGASSRVAVEDGDQGLGLGEWEGLQEQRMDDPAVGDVAPGDAGVRRLPDAAARRAHVVRLRVVGDTGHGDGAAAPEGPDPPPLHRGVQRGVDGGVLGGGGRRRRDSHR